MGHYHSDSNVDADAKPGVYLEIPGFRCGSGNECAGGCVGKVKQRSSLGVLGNKVISCQMFADTD